MLRKIKLSIIIVNYNVSEQVLSCLKSIYDSKPKINFEIIVVDNSVKDNISKKLKNKYSRVKYLKTDRNLGYGAGNNLGVSHAKGEYIFILNPDTKIISGKIDSLVDFANKIKKAGAIAPILLNKNNIPYKLQGMSVLTPKRAIFSLSFLVKLFPRNRINMEYFQIPRNRNKTIEREVVPGTAFIIKKSLFEKVGRFDENFFLYFEEYDLCKRLIDKGYKNYIIPEVNISHEWGASTKLINNKDNYFMKSRYLYFSKHFGKINALITEVFLRFNKFTFLLILFLFIGFCLRVDRLSDVMAFMPDMGLFYLPAKEMLINGTIPLVGPETSHPWIHHGAHWIYVLSGLLWLSNFNPVGAAYFIAVLGTITILIFYLVSREMFGKNIAILSAILYATSPLLVMNARIPYHTSPIPFFVIILFYLTFKWIRGGSVWIFPAITFLLGVLYNHEITTFVYAIVIGILLFYGFIKNESWFRKLINPKIILTSIISFIIPMLPFIIYDLKTMEFNQTLRFLVWVGYRIVKFPLSLIDPRFQSPSSGPSTFSEFFSYYNNLIFSESNIIAFGILIVTFIFGLNYFSKHFRFDKKRLVKVKKQVSLPFALLFLFLVIGLGGLLTHRVPIEADTLLISPFIILLTTLSIFWMFRNKFLPALIFIIIISIFNAYMLFSTDYFSNVNGVRNLIYKDKLKASERIVELSKGENYNLIGKGVLSDYPSFTMPYEYLTWWRGNAPSKTNTKLKIIVWEKENEIIIFTDK